MAAIEMKNIVKEYGDGFKAVNDVNIDVADGELMILVGPSGCGKSTLLRMIVGLEDITSGDMVIGGERVNEKAPRDRQLAMVFQNYALYPHLTVYENIAFPLRLSGSHSDEEIDRKVRGASATLELDEHLERKPANLSGGQRQRVAMGRAIVRDAKAFLFDEPLSNLDAKLRGQMRIEISQLQRQLGITTVYVTHDQTEAMTLGDRVAVLKKGYLQQCATPRELYEQPANLFVAGFIGSPPMNLMPATIRGNRIELPFTEVDLPSEMTDNVQGRDLLIAGVRPGDFEDASLVTDTSNGVVFDACIDAIEWLGNEQYAYVPFEAPPEVASMLQELEHDLDGESSKTQLVVSLDAASRFERGETVQLFMRTDQMHLFDPTSGENLTRRPSKDTDLKHEQGSGDRTEAGASSADRRGAGGAPSGERSGTTVSGMNESPSGGSSAARS